MRYDADHKAGSRSRILKAAAAQIREQGPHAVSVAKVMSAAGLTHGAFYAHFGSKDGLVAEAVSEMFQDAGERAEGIRGLSALEEDAELRDALRTFLAGYLSSSHRDKPDRGCPLPSLAVEVGRTGGQVRRNFVAGMDRMTGRIEAALARLGRATPGADARATVAQMVGAVGLARAMGPGTASDALLRDSFDAIVGRLGL